MLKNNKVGNFIGDLVQKSPGKSFLCKLKIVGGCFIKDTPVLMANINHLHTLKNAGLGLAMAAMPMVSAVPIQDVQLLDYAVAHTTVNSHGDMVQDRLLASADGTYYGLMGTKPTTTNDPYTSDQQRSRDQYQINETDWYEVAFEEINGSSSCKLALHSDWITQHGYSVDGIVNMNLPEMGISGSFRITSIRHIIPQKKPVDEDQSDEWEYRPVTGLFTHQSNDVWKITFYNGELLGVTNIHPIYSVSKGDWSLAGHLEIGEEVLAKGGNTKVISKERDLTMQLVYNLEVKDLHNFLVGESGIVVHNGCLKEYFQLFFGKLTRKKVPGKKWVDYAEESGLATHIDDLKEFDQLEALGENLGERILHFHLSKDKIPFPGIAAITESGVPVSLKKVTSDKIGTLGDNIRAIGEKATSANATEAFGGVMKDITGMVSSDKFILQQIKDKITSVRSLHFENSTIGKKYFIEGKDASGWLEF